MILKRNSKIGMYHLEFEYCKGVLLQIAANMQQQLQQQTQADATADTTAAGTTESTTTSARTFNSN